MAERRLGSSSVTFASEILEVRVEDTETGG